MSKPNSGRPLVRKVKFLLDKDKEAADELKQKTRAEKARAEKLRNEEMLCAGGDADPRNIRNRRRPRRRHHHDDPTAEQQVVQQYEQQHAQLLDQDPDHQMLYNIFQKLEMAEQIALHRLARLLPDVCSAHWRSTCRKLDFRVLTEELPEPNQRNYLLGQMAEHYRYVYFVAHRLQENLNALESAGVKSLNSVQRVELLLLEGEETLPLERIQETPLTADTEAGGDAKPKGMAQWPLHALPKLMRNVKRMKAQCDVQVHFIEHFAQLELLILYGSISQTALTGIFERCQKLERLFLKFNDRNYNQNLSLKSIRKSTKLRDLSVPVALFNRQKEMLMELRQLHLLELTHCEKDVPLTIECMRFVLNQKADTIEQVQLDCKCFAKKHINWMQDVGLERCSRLRGLVLVNCIFGNREICQLTLPCVQKYIALIGCKDIKEYQVLDMVRRCSGLSELYLIDCPQLTWKMLQGLYRIRRGENISYPLTVVLGQCPTLRTDYQSMYSNYWCFKLAYLKIERIQGESRPIEDIQIFFYQNTPQDKNLKPALKKGSTQN
ncbi:uncharacterized protein Dana_GF22607 [Drosophila ananassae]|uniref:F-box domain-containing protein n=1 Tax=Drosophila ananassae TaxID=7217 RepID=B3MW19_DROAN|nr:uncharacterized protein LOC6505264 [Drosophila ananassae]EDV35164.1 uncharacterized protein Dana_GF22607 [Drosophila ananassae]